MYKGMENEILTKFIRIVINKKQLVVSRRLLGSLTVKVRQNVGDEPQKGTDKYVQVR